MKGQGALHPCDRASAQFMHRSGRGWEGRSREPKEELRGGELREEQSCEGWEEEAEEEEA